ncbi:MAG: hypothetical protein LBG58_13220 [Planctomycetaceae bacterium]|jgi:hypothetical protein|nr:hypothetical protein [Planctomycetaceae bacterium]
MVNFSVNINIGLLFFLTFFVSSELFAKEDPIKEKATLRITNNLNSFKQIHGRQISDTEFFSMVTKTDSGVLWEDCRDLWTNFQKIQLPAIPQAALLSILKSTRNSIVSLRYDYEFNLDPVENNVLKKIHETGKCIISGQKVLLKLNNNQKNSKDYLNYIISFDGKVKRIVDFAVDENLPNASIDNIVSLDQFYPMNSLLAALAFLDTKIYRERSEPYYDLITFLEEGGGIILEHVE